MLRCLLSLMTRTKTRANANTPESPVSVIDFGAVGDGITDDTDAINAAIAASKVVTFPTGIYLTRSLTIKDRRCLTLEAEGSFDPVRQDVQIRPFSTVDTLLELGSCSYMAIKGIAFVADNKVTNTILHLRANSAGTPAAGTLRIKFEECSFLVGDGSSVQPTKPVRLSNVGQIEFTRCFFEGGSLVNYTNGGDTVSTSVAVEMGDLDPGNPGEGGDPYGDGGAGQTVFDTCYFKGDVVRVNADHTNWFNCNFYAKPFQSSKVSRLLAPPTATKTAYEKIDNCYSDTFATNNYSGSWYTQGPTGGVEIINSLLAGYNSLVEIKNGDCKIFANRFLSLGGSSGRRVVYLGTNAGKAEIHGNNTSQIESVNSSSVVCRLIVDDRADDVYTHYEKLSGSDFSVSTSESNVFTYPYKSLGTYVKVRAQLALKHGSSNARLYSIKIQYNGTTVGPKRTVTLDTLNEVYAFSMEQVVYLDAETTDRTLAIVVSTSGDSGEIQRDDSWWSVENVYS